MFSVTCSFLSCHPRREEGVSCLFSLDAESQSLVPDTPGMLRKELLCSEAVKWIDGGNICSGNTFLTANSIYMLVPANITEAFAKLNTVPLLVWPSPRPAPGAP